MSTLAVVGVSAQLHFPNAILQLKKNGLKKAYIAFDMDYHTNPHVRNAMIKLMATLDMLGIRYSQVKWVEPEKGLDDFILAQRIWRFARIAG
jgi:hypothetical protein